MKQYSVSDSYIVEATLALLEKEVRDHVAKDRSPFTMKKLLGVSWDVQYVPFYKMFDHLEGKQQDKTAVQQMGRLFKKVCVGRLGLKDRQVDDGKGHKHSEYSLPSEGASS